MNGGQSANEETLYVFQDYGYFGLPQLGQISFGQENGPSVIFETGASITVASCGTNGCIGLNGRSWILVDG